jgi:Skp family chaperone for outer membrane proteins
MKIRAFAILAFVLTANAVSAQSAIDKWPAIKEFHTVISATFHPAEEGNLEPIKSRSQELYDKASALLKSDIPAEFRTNAILASAEKLQTKSRVLYKLVQAKAADADIAKAITEVHTVFHDIVGLCSEEKK